jgi:predicted methyltransferase
MLAVAIAALSLTAAAVAKPDANALAAVADKGRPEADTRRDADRKPAEMMEFAGVEPGQVVVDFMPGGGYFTRIFSKAVGPTGVVYAISPPLPPPPKGVTLPPPPPGVDAIAADPAYGNVRPIHAAFAAFAVPQKADLIWTALNYHDLHTSMFNVDTAALNKAIYDSLKPGGYYVVVDHAAAAGSPLSTIDTMHRIDPAIVRKEVEAAGFKLVAQSDALRNPADDHSLPMMKVERGHTDQFMLKFQKPQ